MDACTVSVECHTGSRLAKGRAVIGRRAGVRHDGCLRKRALTLRTSLTGPAYSRHPVRLQPTRLAVTVYGRSRSNAAHASTVYAG